MARVTASRRTVGPSTADVVVPSTVALDELELIRSVITRYPVIAEPPVDDGADHVAVAVRAPPALPRVAVPMIGAPGTVASAAGVTVFDDAESSDEPMLLTALTWKRYVVPLVSPVTDRLVAGAPAVRNAPTCAPVALATTRTS